MINIFKFKNIKVKVYDLLFALMLPSGNDAAYVLAENLGFIIKCDKKNRQDKLDFIK